MSCCLSAAEEIIPLSGNNNKKSGNSIPGWTTHVESSYKQAKFWHKIWKENGSPRNGVIADIRRKTRSQYHYTVKYVRNNADTILSNKMAETLLYGNINEFWKSVGRAKASKSVLPSTIDGVCGIKDISDVFAEKYKKLYNSVPYNFEDMKNFQLSTEENIHNLCSKGQCYCDHSFNVADILCAVTKLKCNKSDGWLGHSTDHIINGTNKLCVYLSLLFTGMLRHGYIPDAMLISTMVPIPKNKKKVSEQF